MASRLMHIAISCQLEPFLQIQDANRFRIGHILPDSIVHGKESHADAHFKKSTADGRRMMDFADFFERYQHKILTDDLYLGYYFHLIQDAIYRQFMYQKWDITYTKDVRMDMYRDYGIVNRYLIDKYHICNDVSLPENFAKEEINQIYPFTLAEFLEELKRDFQSSAEGELKYLKKERVDQYICESAQVCRSAYDGITGKGPLLDPILYAWDVKREL